MSPRNVRNFWIEAQIDGRHSKFAGGPQSKEDGFDLTIKMRDHGTVVNTLDIIGRVVPVTFETPRTRLKLTLDLTVNDGWVPVYDDATGTLIAVELFTNR